MKRFIYQFISLVFSLAVLIFIFQLMWILAIPVLLVFLSIWAINGMKKYWEKGKIPPSATGPIRPHQVIDVEYREVEKE